MARGKLPKIVGICGALVLSDILIMGMLSIFAPLTVAELTKEHGTSEYAAPLAEMEKWLRRSDSQREYAHKPVSPM